MATVDEMNYGRGSKSRLATAVLSAMQFAGSFTDMLIHEGEPIRLKMARGIVSIKDLNIPGGDLIVSADDIRHYFAYYIDGDAGRGRAANYWEQQIVPTLNEKMAVNRSLPTADGAHLRLSLFQHSRGKLAMVVRITTPPPKLDNVGLTPQLIERIKNNPRGLLIITGPTASGKTSTALSILEWLNQNRPGHIITVEDPIEYPMVAAKCVFTQREVGVDVSNFGEGLRDAMRHSPDAILAGEIRDRDTAECAVYGGESGALMVVTTHGRSVTGTLRKILTLTGEQSGAMREVMAGSLIGVVRQELVPTASRDGYHMVCDTLHMTENVKAALEKGDWSGLDKLTNNESMPSPDFVPMTTQLKILAEKQLVDSDALKSVIGRNYKT